MKNQALERAKRVRWSNLATALVIVGLILDKLRTAPIPATWRPWVELAAGLVGPVVTFFMQPERQGEEEAETEEEAPEAGPDPGDALAAKAAATLERLTPEEAVALAKALGKAGIGK